MKNNPFLPWFATDVVMGRREEMKIAAGFINEVASGKGGLMAVIGSPGSGRTTLFSIAKKEAKAAGLLSGFVKAGRNEKESGIVKALKAEFEDDLSRLSHTNDVAFGKARHFSDENIGTFNQLFSSLARTISNRNIFIIIDDFDSLQKADDIARSIVKAAERKTGAVGALVSATRAFPLPPAAVIIQLKPITEDEFRIYVEEFTKKTAKFGDECIKAIYADGGGNPKVMQLALWYLYDNAKETDRVISRAQYTANIRGILGMLSHEWFSSQYFEASEEEKRLLRQLAQNGEQNVTALASSLGKKPGPVATLLMRLEQRGDILKVARGRYKVFCPLYAKFIMERS